MTINTKEILSSLTKANTGMRVRTLDWDASDVDYLRHVVRRLRSFAKRWDLDESTIVVLFDGGAVTNSYTRNNFGATSTYVEYRGGTIRVGRGPVRSCAGGDTDGMYRATIEVPAGHPARKGARGARFASNLARFE
uniref:Uncharacterized protein n=1 Tax=viral metagenome TaxID=1070528 RepID=A0A6M3KPE6_9ZZZZ